MQIRDTLVPNPLVIPPTTTLLEFIERVLATNQTTAVIVENDKMVGIASVKDIYRRIMPHYIDMDDKLARVIHDGYFEEKFEKFKLTTIGEAMTTDFDFLAPDDPVMAAVVMFVRRGRKTIPVLEDGKYVGSITRRSVLTAVAKAAKT
jgi:CBS domain-containing protein